MSEPEHETTIAELFATNPLQLSDQDINKIIAKQRANRVSFVAGNKSAGKPTNKITKTDTLQAKATSLVPDLDLDDLGI